MVVVVMIMIIAVAAQITVHLKTSQCYSLLNKFLATYLSSYMLFVKYHTKPCITK